jgi:hypothetical protein
MAGSFGWIKVFLVKVCLSQVILQRGSWNSKGLANEMVASRFIMVSLNIFEKILEVMPTVIRRNSRSIFSSRML